MGERCGECPLECGGCDEGGHCPDHCRAPALRLLLDACGVPIKGERWTTRSRVTLQPVALEWWRREYPDAHDELREAEAVQATERMLDAMHGLPVPTAVSW